MKISHGRFFIILFWLIMTGWLIRFEAFPHWFTRTFSGYRTLLESRPFILDSWMQITFNDVPMGYSHTWIDSNIESQTESHTIRNKTVLHLNLFGERQSITVFANVVLDNLYRMDTFSTMLHSKSYKTQIEGKRIDDKLFEINIRTPAGDQTVTLPMPEDVMLYSPMSELAVQRLRPGEVLNFRVFDPVLMKTTEIRAEALRREKLRHNESDIQTVVLKISYMGLETLIWIDSEGRALRHETPFGWIMTASSADKILTANVRLLQAANMLSALAIPVRGAFTDPREAKELLLRLNGIPFDPVAISSDRQFVERKEGALLMRVMAQKAPPKTERIGFAVPARHQQHLESSAYIQTDHPDIARHAEIITGTHTNSFEAAKAISAWIQDNVQTKPTVSLPSALDVLKERVGDCNEITYLFVALARASGIPARVHVGIVYAETEGRKAFYYHAWPSVYVGSWVEMDPTWGETTVGASHISFVTGEIGDQMQLIALLGQASVEIMSINP